MYQFEIPYNFDKELIEQLNMLQIDEQIHSIYLPPYKEDYITAKHYYTHLRGRHDVYNSLPGNREEYESHIKLINQLFPNRLMLLLQQNNTLIKKELLYYYFNLGFRKFCVGSYNQAKIIRDELKDTNIEIIGSITMKIMPQDLNDKKYEIFNSFVLWFPYNRNIYQIKKMPIKYKYILLVNCDCSIYCSGTQHWLASSLEEELKNNDYCPHKYLKHNFEDTIRIKPEDLILFEPYISYFKLQGREYKTFDLILDICKYTMIDPNKKPNNKNLYYNNKTDKLFNQI